MTARITALNSRLVLVDTVLLWSNQSLALYLEGSLRGSKSLISQNVGSVSGLEFLLWNQMDLVQRPALPPCNCDLRQITSPLRISFFICKMGVHTHDTGWFWELRESMQVKCWTQFWQTAYLHWGITITIMGIMGKTRKPIMWLLCGDREKQTQRGRGTWESLWETVDTGFRGLSSGNRIDEETPWVEVSNYSLKSPGLQRRNRRNRGWGNIGGNSLGPGLTAMPTRASFICFSCLVLDT